MTNIQHARDVLAKWRERAIQGTWDARQDTPSMSGSNWTLRVHGTPGIRASVNEYQHGDGLARLIVGTAGNPDLLDAIDAMLKNAQWHIDSYGSVEHPWASLIAAAIIAADTRMNA